MQDTDPNPLQAVDARALRRKLLAWYRQHRRAMPWRTVKGETPDPYHVLVSEAMLQQTQVATVIPYFRRFIEAFPTVDALAEADEQRVLTLWQGLGYYRRARHLHAAAKAIVERFGSQVPATVERLLELPGVGKYTAGAVASIAHGTRAAVVDGNVERVLSRLLLIEEPINAPATKKKLWPIAEALVPKTSPGDYNQAVMELGALVCSPKVPKCFVCPVRGHCRAVQEADPEKLPVKLAKKKPKDVTHLVVAAERGGKYLFEQRPSDGLWSNMWQLPTWEAPLPDVLEPLTSEKSSDRSRRVTTRGTTRDTPTTARAPRSDAAATSTALFEWFRSRFGLSLEQLSQTADFTHQTTHRTIRFVVLRASVKSGRLKPKSGVWRSLDQVDDLPMSNPQRESIRHLQKSG
jgi:A/G-specific adenine glycosylase